MTRVFVEPIGVTVEIPDGETLLAVVTSGAVDVPVDCMGRGTCGKCLVRTGAGRFSEPTEAELRKVPAMRREEGWRLACQTTPLSEHVSIEVRETQGRRQILTASTLHPGEPDPAVTRELLELSPATLEDKRSDRERLTAALGVDALPLSVLRTLPTTLRDHDWRAAVTRYEGRVIDVEGADVEDGAYGAAVDVGTSKIIVYLFDLTSGKQLDTEAVENPQMRFGEDIVSRMTQALHEGRLTNLATAVREGVNGLLAAVCERQRIDPSRVYDMTVVGNTAMHHLALGISPAGLGSAPFAPAVAEPLTLRGADLGLAMNPEGGVHFPPPIAGFVGSDCLGVIAATRLADATAPTMAIDIGTNTEIALVHDGRIAVTSCASGPAFEGYQISCGIKAVEGAIERVSIAPDGLPEAVVTVGGRSPVGICGSGVVDVLAGLVAAGVVDATGRLQPHERVRGRGDGSGLEYLLAAAGDGGSGDIVFTQQDVRALQLAKAAIASGWKLLLAEFGLRPVDLDRVLIAGSFGNNIDAGHALAIGLLPPVPQKRVSFVGNAAGVGAQMALIDLGERRAMAALARRLTFLDLATNKDFHEVFTGELSFA